MKDPPFGILYASCPDGLAACLEFETVEDRDRFKNERFDLWAPDAQGKPIKYLKNIEVSVFISKVLTGDTGGPDGNYVLYLDVFNLFTLDGFLDNREADLLHAHKEDSYLGVTWKGTYREIYIQYGRRESQKKINENLAVIHNLDTIRKRNK